MKSGPRALHLVSFSHSLFLHHCHSAIDPHALIVAIAYVSQKVPYVFPIIGGRKVEHLLANIEALDITLSPEQITYLESIVPFELGFPYWIIVRLIHVFSPRIGTTNIQNEGHWIGSFVLHH